MKRLIERKYYATQQEVIDRLNMFMLFNQITTEQYAELMVLTENTYNPKPEVPEVPEEPEVPEA